MRELNGHGLRTILSVIAIGAAGGLLTANAAPTADDGDFSTFGEDLMKFARDGMIDEVLKMAKAAHVEKAESVDAALSTALNKANSVEARANALLSLAISELPATIPVNNIAGLLTDRQEDTSIRNGALFVCMALLHQQQSVEKVEAALFRILNSRANDAGVRLGTANTLLHFGPSKHALARAVSKAMDDPELPEDSIESFGMGLYALALYRRISTDEAVNWLISRHPSAKMTTGQKLKYFSAIGYLEDHEETFDDDRLDDQTAVDMQLYFEQEFSTASNSDRVRGFAATFIKNPDVLRPETIQAAKDILDDASSSKDLQKDANRVLSLVK